MIQEKDFLYRVPVKNALVTAPGKQVRNPEILVDLEGGEFMHGDILDANSTNKLIDQSVKDAIDNSIENGNYVTKDLLEAETIARTKSDEDLSAKIKAEQTRAEGKEKEISDKLAIVDGDSNTEGSFRKAIKDLINGAPEAYDTLKEIADKLEENDNLNQAINEAIAKKASKEELNNYVTDAALKALEKKVSDNTAAISDKQDAGNYIPYNKYDNVFYYLYNVGIISQKEDGYNQTIQSPVFFEQSDENHSVTIRNGYINISNTSGDIMTLNKDDKDGGIVIYKQLTNSIKESLRILEGGIRLMGGDNNHVLTSNATTIDITQYALKSVYDEKIAALEARIAALEAKHAETD